MTMMILIIPNCNFLIIRWYCLSLFDEQLSWISCNFDNISKDLFGVCGVNSNELTPLGVSDDFVGDFNVNLLGVSALFSASITFLSRGFRDLRRRS